MYFVLSVNVHVHILLHFGENKSILKVVLCINNCILRWLYPQWLHLLGKYVLYTGTKLDENWMVWLVWVAYKILSGLNAHWKHYWISWILILVLIYYPLVSVVSAQLRKLDQFIFKPYDCSTYKMNTKLSIVSLL